MQELKSRPLNLEVVRELVTTATMRERKKALLKVV